MTVRVVEKIPKTKDEIQRMIIAELRTFAQCEKAWGIVSHSIGKLKRRHVRREGS